MDVDVVPPKDVSPIRSPPPRQNHTTLMVPLVDEKRNRRTTSDSFFSARENITSRLATEEPTSQTEIAPDSQAMQVDNAPVTVESTKTQVPEKEDVVMIDDDDLRSPSDGSSPIKPVFRKSSLNFSSLPAREPLAKNSIGARNSQLDQKPFGSIGGTTTAPRITSATATEIEKPIEPVEKTGLSQQFSEAARAASKKSTQTLHDKINMLGQSSQRTSNFLASFDKLHFSQASTAVEKQSEPSFSQRMETVNSVEIEHDEDDWIAPIKKPVSNLGRPISQVSLEKYHTSHINPVEEAEEPQGTFTSPSRPILLKKMASTTLLESSTKKAMAPDPATLKQISVSNPTPILNAGTTTPNASPPRSPGGRKIFDAPLSASKAKFYSVLKSAKGIFASSAGVSAHAKLEALSPGRVRRPADDGPPSPTADIAPKPALLPSVLSGDKKDRLESPDGRRLRSSTEQKRKDDEEKQRMRVDDDLERVRQKERQKAATAAAQKMNRAPPPKVAASRPGLANRTETETSRDDATEDVPPPVPPKTTMPSSKIRDPRRVPVPKPAPKDGAASRAKPAPVMIRVPSQRIGQPAAPATAPSTASLSQSLGDTLPPPVPPKNAVTKPAGITAHSNSSTTSLKNAAMAKRAMTAATKKKEHDVKLAQRKADQKREFEQKRAQRIEEERKLEHQRKAAEQIKMQEARKAAQRQAEEVKRKDQTRPESRQQGLANGLQNERAAQGTHPRGDVPPRPMSKMNMVPDSARPTPQVNPAKPVKRALPDAEEHGQRQNTVSRPQQYQQLDSKRRKTGEEDEAPQQRASALGPPIRQSTVKKVRISCPSHSMLTISGSTEVWPCIHTWSA
jgi:hypothetical protein